MWRHFLSAHTIRQTKSLSWHGSATARPFLPKAGLAASKFPNQQVFFPSRPGFSHVCQSSFGWNCNKWHWQLNFRTHNSKRHAVCVFIQMWTKHKYEIFQMVFRGQWLKDIAERWKGHFHLISLRYTNTFISTFGIIFSLDKTSRNLPKHWRKSQNLQRRLLGKPGSFDTFCQGGTVLQLLRVRCCTSQWWKVLCDFCRSAQAIFSNRLKVKKHNGRALGCESLSISSVTTPHFGSRLWSPNCLCDIFSANTAAACRTFGSVSMQATINTHK